MDVILIRAGSLAAIIVLGYWLRRIGYFKEEDFKVLSKILVKITLPGVIVSSFVGKQIEPKMLTISLISLGAGVIYMGIAYLMTRRESKDEKAFAVINSSGYNIGAFTMPFAQGFIGATGVVITSLFDIGNAFICFGGSLGMGIILKEGKGFSLKKIGKTLITSVAFDCYVIMTIMSLLRISIPAPVASFSKIIGDANAFVAMLMIGIGFKLSGGKSQFKKIGKILILRYTISALVATGCYFLLPFSKLIRTTLVILAFSPIPAAAPAYTEEVDGDVGMASAVNSMTIICSLIFIVVLSLILL